MTLARQVTVAVTAGLLLAPAPAFAAAAGDHTTGGHHHHGRHHSTAKHHRGTGTHHGSSGLAGRRAHLRAQLAALRHQVNRLDRALAGAPITDHQQRVLAARFAARDDLAGLRRALAGAHDRRSVRRVAERIHRVGATVPAQVELVRWVGEIDGGLHSWRRLQRRLDGDDQCVQENEENPDLMRDLDTAVSDLDAAQETLAGDEQLLLAAAGHGADALRQAMHQVIRDLGTVSGDVLDAVAALEDLESQLNR